MPYIYTTYIHHDCFINVNVCAMITLRGDNNALQTLTVDMLHATPTIRGHTFPVYIV